MEHLLCGYNIPTLNLMIHVNIDDFLNIDVHFLAASIEVCQAYKQFIAAVVELIDGEVASEYFREVALLVYYLFTGPRDECEDDTRIAEKK